MGFELNMDYRYFYGIMVYKNGIFIYITYLNRNSNK